MSNVTWFPTLADAPALLDEFLPQMIELCQRPHRDHDEEWRNIRDRLDTIFDENGWKDGDESRIAFDLLVAFAWRESGGSGS